MSSIDEYFAGVRDDLFQQFPEDPENDDFSDLFAASNWNELAQAVQNHGAGIDYDQDTGEYSLTWPDYDPDVMAIDCEDS
jgi:hypothetical protein